MKLKELIKRIPFLIAFILVLISIIQVLMSPDSFNEDGETISYTLNDSILYASFGLIMVLILIIIKNNYWKHAFGILLIIALTSFIEFFSQTLSIEIGFLNFELTALVLLILHLFLNKEVLKDTVKFFM